MKKNQQAIILYCNSQDFPYFTRGHECKNDSINNQMCRKIQYLE